MATLESRIEKARQRASGTDIEALARQEAGLSVDQLATDEAVKARAAFLAQETPISFGEALERVIAGNELQPVNYLEKGAVAARAVGRITMQDGSGRSRGYGTGFLVAPGLLLTNNHVLETADWARRSFVEFDYALGFDDQPRVVAAFGFDPDALFVTDAPLDFTLVAVRPAGTGREPLDAYGHLPLIAKLGKAVEGEWLTIIQHPDGDRKKVCVRENRFLKRTPDVLWYSTDTLGGSSGSPVFNNEWQVVALHHSGVPETVNGQIMTVQGRPFDRMRDRESDIKWIANEGIRVSRIVETLRPRLGGNRLGARLLAESGPAKPVPVQPAAIVLPDAPSSDLPPEPSLQPVKDTAMASFPVRVTVEIDAEGRPRIVEAAAPVVPPAPDRSRTNRLTPPFDADYASRIGYKPKWLEGGTDVPLPDLGPHRPAAAELIGAPGQIELRYAGYSVLMHARRRLALVSAANVDFAQRYALSRPSDSWRLDPRIPAEAQLGEFYYARNKFDRGHLTRREDMEYGPTRFSALETATDTFHFTNCVPQHERFNQNRDTWAGLEMHLLEDSVKRTDFRATIFTGPLLAEDDPVWDRFPDIQYPRRFWKVAVARTAAGKLFATAFILDQSEAIERFGIEATDVPFTAFKTFQVKVAEVERLTGFRFDATVGSKKGLLNQHDPLATPLGESLAVRARGVVEARESSAGGWQPAPAGYVPLDTLEALVLPPVQ